MGLFSFPGKDQQDADDDLDVPVKPRRSRRAQAQDEEPMDPMLPEKQRARRRLIGATALVLAAIIGLPMIFDADPQKPVADDIEFQIPDKAAPSSAATTSQPTPQTAPQALPPKAEIEMPATTTAPVKNGVVPDGRAATDATPKIKPGTPAVDKPAAESKAERKTESEQEKPQAQEKARQYVLQIAAVNSKAKAEELQSRLKQSGIKAYSRKISTPEGDRFRVRVGPFDSREEAEKMQQRVKKAGLSGSVQSL